MIENAAYSSSKKEKKNSLKKSESEKGQIYDLICQ